MVKNIKTYQINRNIVEIVCVQTESRLMQRDKNYEWKRERKIECTINFSVTQRHSVRCHRVNLQTVHIYSAIFVEEIFTIQKKLK